MHMPTIPPRAHSTEQGRAGLSLAREAAFLRRTSTGLSDKLAIKVEQDRAREEALGVHLQTMAEDVLALRQALTAQDAKVETLDRQLHESVRASVSRVPACLW